MGAGTTGLRQLVSIIKFHRYGYWVFIDTNTNSYTNANTNSYTDTDTNPNTDAIPSGLLRVYLCHRAGSRSEYM